MLFKKEETKNVQANAIVHFEKNGVIWVSLKAKSITA